MAMSELEIRILAAEIVATEITPGIDADKIADARVVCLDIPDISGFMDAELVRRLEARAPRRLGL